MAPWNEETAKAAFWHVLGLYETDRIIGSTWYRREARLCAEEQGQVANQRMVECFCPMMALMRFLDEGARCIGGSGPGSDLVEKVEHHLGLEEQKIMGFACNWDERWEDFINTHNESDLEEPEWTGDQRREERWEMLEALRPYFVTELGKLLHVSQLEIQKGLEASEAKLGAYLDAARG